MKQNIYRSFAIIGAGAWGSALACQIARNNNNVILYTIEQQVVDEIRENHTNNKYLPGIIFPQNIKSTSNFMDILQSQVIVIASPSNVFFDIIHNLKNINLSHDIVIVIATKGLAKNPGRLFSQIIAQELPSNKFAFIAGPNFAREVAAGLYSHITIASDDLSVANNLARSIADGNFVADITDDITTIQLAGIIKNIIAIKSGINEAKHKGENAKAALITNAMKEIRIISEALGGKDETLLTPGVLGDLVLTAYSTTSRNMKFGYELERASNKAEFLANYPHLVEGKESINALMDLIKRYNLELPIINSVFQTLDK